MTLYAIFSPQRDIIADITNSPHTYNYQYWIAQMRCFGETVVRVAPLKMVFKDSFIQVRYGKINIRKKEKINRSFLQGRWYPRTQAQAVFETFLWSAFKAKLFIDCFIQGDNDFRTWAETQTRAKGYEVYG